MCPGHDFGLYRHHEMHALPESASTWLHTQCLPSLSPWQVTYGVDTMCKESDVGKKRQLSHESTLLLHQRQTRVLQHAQYTSHFNQQGSKLEFKSNHQHKQQAISHMKQQQAISHMKQHELLHATHHDRQRIRGVTRCSQIWELRRESRGCRLMLKACAHPV